MSDNYIVRYIDLPLRVGGISVLSPDGFTNIYINALLPDELQKESIDHELAHIKENHLYSDIPIQKAEEIANETRG